MRRLCGIAGLLVIQSAALAQTNAPLVDRVLTQQEQEALTPGAVLRILQEGNQRFVSAAVTRRDHSAQVRDAVSGQFPKGRARSRSPARCG